MLEIEYWSCISPVSVPARFSGGSGCVFGVNWS